MNWVNTYLALFRPWAPRVLHPFPRPVKRGFAFSQHSSSLRLIEDETFNDSGIFNNLIDYEDGQEEPDSLRQVCRDPAFQQIGKAFS
ncbi:hypothetical protein TNCV_4618111 [Trichonephila clavipes]|nr:hypothetical protein TNCV_4618111 [Trichonephila clavipes]